MIHLVIGEPTRGSLDNVRFIKYIPLKFFRDPLIFKVKTDEYDGEKEYTPKIYQFHLILFKFCTALNDMIQVVRNCKQRREN